MVAHSISIPVNGTFIKIKRKRNGIAAISRLPKIKNSVNKLTTKGRRNTDKKQRTLLLT